MLLHDFIKITENKTTVEDFKEILRIFLPVAKKVLKLDKLPTIILKNHLEHLEQPTMGRFFNNTFTLELAIADRHPVDTLRTLAHELVHAKQESEHADIDPATGSDSENEANVIAGIIMREFNKQYPEFLKATPISEGGNLAIGGKEAEQINLKVTNRGYIVPVLNNLLNAINTAFAKQYKTPLWKPELLKSQKFLSGSSLHFFNVKGIPDEQFVAKKPKVGDIDTMVSKEAEANLDQFLTSIQGQQIGPATLVGYQRGNEQFSSLWELQDPPIKIQIDLEFVAFDKDEPTAWARFSHSSSWEDLEAGVKGVFHKFLIQSLPALGRKEFLLRKLVGRGKARAEQDVPTEDNMVSFAVSSKEGGGLRAKYEPVLDDQGLPLIKDNLQVMRALPAEGYEQDIDKIFLTLFGDRLGPKQAKALSKNYWSFTGLLNVMNQILNSEEKSIVVNSFIKKLFDKGAQGLYRGDPERDAAEKTAALDLLFKTLQIQAPADLEQMKADYKASYKVTSESIFEAPNYKRQGIQHIYNPGSSTEMKDLEFVEMCKEIAENGGTLDGMAVNLKADGAGIRFGKDESGRPFFMTSKVTEPKYIDNYGDFEQYATEAGQSPERIAFAKNYDEALKIILNSKFMDAIPADTIVQAEMMYNPMAQKTKDGLQFVNIPYDPAKLGKTMTLVPFMFKQYSTGETLPNAQEIKKNVLATSDANVKLVNNQMQQQGVNVSKIISPVVQMNPALIDSLKSRTRVNPEKEKAKEIITKARQELSNAIINSPAITGKDALGKNIEGLVVNLPSGRLAKVTSQMMKGAVAAKQAVKKGATKTAVVAIGSFVGHIGHEQLWNYTLQKAKQVSGDPYLFIGHAVGADDPIPPEIKVQTWQKLYPEYKDNISTVSVSGGSLMQKIKHELINPQPGQPPKYDNIIIMVGEDQAKMNIAQALMKAVNKFPGYEHVKVQLEVTPRGTGMSFTKLRNILKDPNATPEQQYAVWAQGFNEKKLGKDYILHLMDVARKGMGIQQPQPKVAERLFNSLMNIGTLEAKEPKPTVVVPGGDNPDAPHTPIKGDVPVVRGDIVMAQDPDNIASVFTGRVKRIGRTHVFIIKKNGEEIAVPHDQVSKDYDVLSRQAHKILNKKGKHIGNYKVDENINFGKIPMSTLWEEQEEELRQELLKNPQIFENTNDYKNLQNFLSLYKDKKGTKGQSYLYTSVASLLPSHNISIAHFNQPYKLVKIEKNRAYFEINGEIKQYPEGESVDGDLLKTTILFSNIKEFKKFLTMLGMKFSEWHIKTKVIGQDVSEYQDRMAGVGMGNYVVDKNTTEGTLSIDVAHALKRYGEHVNNSVYKELGKLFSLNKIPTALLMLKKSDPEVRRHAFKIISKAGGKLGAELAKISEDFEKDEYVQTLTNQFLQRAKLGHHNTDEGTIMRMLSKFFEKFSVPEMYFDGVYNRVMNIAGTDQPTDETKQRLDPKCWKGYRKQGTKVKGNTRVNNCVKIGENWEQEISKLITILESK